MLSHKALEGKVIEGKHEKLISKELFFKVNEVMSDNNNGYKVTLINDDLPLKRFIKCDTCSKYMRGYKASKNQEFYYKCNTIRCKNNKRADELHEQFKTQLSKYGLNSEKINNSLIKECMNYVYYNLTEQKTEEISVVENKLLNYKIK
jgi:site-specific DNA recombinase